MSEAAKQLAEQLMAPDIAGTPPAPKSREWYAESLIDEAVKDLRETAEGALTAYIDARRAPHRENHQQHSNAMQELDNVLHKWRTKES